jgi:hypothetical protein
MSPFPSGGLDGLSSTNATVLALGAAGGGSA